MMFSKGVTKPLDFMYAIRSWSHMCTCIEYLTCKMHAAETNFLMRENRSIYHMKTGTHVTWSLLDDDENAYVSAVE